MQSEGRSSGFLPSRGALCSICTSFASDRVPLFFGTRTCGRRVASHTRSPTRNAAGFLRNRITQACPACPARSALLTSPRTVIRENCGPPFVANGCNAHGERPPRRFVGRDSWIVVGQFFLFRGLSFSIDIFLSRQRVNLEFNCYWMSRKLYGEKVIVFAKLGTRGIFFTFFL